MGQPSATEQQDRHCDAQHRADVAWPGSQRFSDLERLIDGVSQKMLAQQLRQMEEDGLVVRTVHPEVPPRVECRLSAWGEALCPALEAMLNWIEARSRE